MLASEVHQFIRSRRSVRRFLPDPVPDEILQRIMETALWAPSAHNRQPWRFAVLAGAASRKCLTDAMGEDFRRDLLADGLPLEQVEAQVERSRQRIVEAPVAILLCLDSVEMDTYPDERRQEAEYQMVVQSVAMAGQNLLLAAHAEGLGAVWICAPLFAQDTARRALSLPETWQPQGLVLLGYIKAITSTRGRKSIAEVAKFLG
jgi:coenzyme F420-0:L-glutamate ligase/coenzyme F420-1:gamma-L-glutamate ligase